MTTFIIKGFKDKDLLEKASLPTLRVGPAMGPKHGTSSPESKNKYLGERNCTKDVDLFLLFMATTSVLKKVGKVLEKSASHPFAEINCEGCPGERHLCTHLLAEQCS